MVFNSVIFLFIFLPLVVAVHTLLRKWRTAQNVWLMLSSFVFYGWANTRILLFLWIFGIVNYWFSLLLESYREKHETKWLVLIPGIVLNALCLYVTKYLGFTIDTINRILNTSFSSQPDILLPLGISFLVFTTISYLADIYRGKCKALRNPIDYFLYISLFVKVSQGPITTASEMSDDIASARKVSLNEFTIGLNRFIIGLAKKVLIADILGSSVDTVFGKLNSGISAGTAWLALLAYAFQILFDFSGYTDMAIGLGAMLGFHLPENFDKPYLSLSVSEFWRRWHMTLGRWFREYIYIPMGGNRRSTPRVILNLAVVWMITGLWHGASVHYVVWGIYFGCFVILEKFINKKAWYQKIPAFFKWLYTFSIVTFGWLLFRSNSMTDIGIYLASMFGVPGGTVSFYTGYYFDSASLCALAAAILLTLPRPKKTEAWISEHAWFDIIKRLLSVVLLLGSIVCMINSTYQAFIYFQF